MTSSIIDWAVRNIRFSHGHVGYYSYWHGMVLLSLDAYRMERAG